MDTLMVGQATGESAATCDIGGGEAVGEGRVTVVWL